MATINFPDLRNKTCIITGGAGIIGRSVCEALAASGVRTAIVDVDWQSARTLAADLVSRHGTPCLGVRADVTDKKSLLEAAEYIRENLGDADFLINGAGGNSPLATTKSEQLLRCTGEDLEGSFFGLDLQGFEKVFTLNFTGTLLPVMVFARDMAKKGKGVILNFSSMNAFRPLTRIPAYSAAKASVNNFTQWLAVHLAKTGIRVNAIAPGFFLTSQNRFLLVDEKTGQPTDRGRKIIAATPAGRYGNVEELQGAVLFLLSESSSFITGIVLPVDGGFNAYSGV